MKLPPCKLVETSPDFIPNGILTSYTQFQASTFIKDHKFNDCFLAGPGHNEIEIRFTTDEYHLVYTQDYATSKYFQIFTPSDRQSIAVEPMTCSINAFNNKQGLIILKAGESCRCAYGVRIEL